MHLRFVDHPTEDDVTALSGFESSFRTDTVYAVTVSEGGFALVEERVEPRTKAYELAGGWDVLIRAEDEGELVGVAATTYHAWNRRQVLDELHVSPGRRRQGIARRLLAGVVGTAQRNGAREVWAETQNVNVPAIRAYRRLGFALTGLDTTLYAGSDEIALFLSLPVPPGAGRE